VSDYNHKNNSFLETGQCIHNLGVKIPPLEISNDPFLFRKVIWTEVFKDLGSLLLKIPNILVRNNLIISTKIPKSSKFDPLSRGVAFIYARTHRRVAEI